MRTRRALLATAAVGGLFAALTGPAPAGAAEHRVASIPTDVRAITWNICGASKTACWNYSFGDRYSKVWEMKTWVEKDPRVSVVMFNESCKSYYGDYLKKQLNATGTGNWKVYHVNGPNIETGKLYKCDPDINQPTDAGVTIAVKQFSGGDPKPLKLTFPSTNGRPDKTQHAACFKDDPNKFLACTVHLPARSADPDKHQRQASVKSLHDLLEKYQDQGYRTVAGGDFNLKPGDAEIEPMYEGNFEADPQHGETRKGTGKIDYMFFSDYGWDLLNGNPILSGQSEQYNKRRLSDHWMMQGTVRVANG
ncbi:endonuclease/exonuclease/phosphatase family protein [Streptomyces asiaticus]|uniref:endonuclease/exonuclease/phosphatase family protein n=1 Tax=Streptomyces asiaticus TaxID=114695 RepID=UPI003F673CB6